MDNVTSPPADLVQRLPGLAAVMITLYVIIWVVGVFGNIMVLYTVVKHKPMRTNTNIFIGCLSVSDLALCSAIPFSPVSALINNWPLGLALCKLVPYIQMTSVLVSTFISVAIAVDRFIIIIYPHYPRMTRNLQNLIITIITLLAAVSSLPVLIFSKLVKQNNLVRCNEAIPSDFWRSAFSWFVLSLQLMIPGIIIIACYSAISARLHRRVTNTLLGTQGARIKEDARRSKKVNKMFISMIVIFVGCWLPLDLLGFIFPLLDDTDGYLDLYIYLPCHVLAMSSVIYNPFLYGWMNDNFNKHFMKTLHCDKKQCDGSQLTRLETFKKNSDSVDNEAINGTNPTDQSSCPLIKDAINDTQSGVNEDVLR